MVLNNIKSRELNGGFTIVELLVVIVVIGILAAITVVSYTGITDKANTAKAQSNAASLQSVAEVYATEHTGFYPTTTAGFATTVGAKLPAGISVAVGLAGVNGAFTGSPASIATLWGTTILAANFSTTATWACMDGCVNPTGGRITYYDFATKTQSTNVLYVGAGSATATFTAPAS